jgi:hypothetical protein
MTWRHEYTIASYGGVAAWAFLTKGRSDARDIAGWFALAALAREGWAWWNHQQLGRAPERMNEFFATKGKSSAIEGVSL